MVFVALISVWLFFGFSCPAGARWRPDLSEGAGWEVLGRVRHHQVLQAQQPEAPLDHLGTNAEAAEAQLLQDRPPAHHPRDGMLRHTGRDAVVGGRLI